MTTQLAFVSPSSFVGELLQPGLPTAAGPVPLSRYVSTYRRSPLAAAVNQQLSGLIAGHVATPTGHDAAVAALRRLRQDVVAGGGMARDTNWRHLFSGHGQPAHLQALWNFILANRGLLQALPPLHAQSDRGTRHDAPARDFAWSNWFATGNPLPAMVRDGVFGYDCLGLVGNYLVRAGLEREFPEREVAGYTALRSLTPLTELDPVRPLCLLVWPASDHASQHIAIVDRVHRLRNDDPNHPRLEVDLAQCAGIGPQVNSRVTIARSAGVTLNGRRGPLQAFCLAELGSPAAPVRTPFALLQHRDWQLASA